MSVRASSRSSPASPWNVSRPEIRRSVRDQPATSPLWDAPNLYISPHNAAISEPQAIARYIAVAIHAFESGEPLPNVVDRRRGY